MHSANVRNQRFGCLPNIDCQGTTMIEFLVLISDNKKNGVTWSCVPISLDQNILVRCYLSFYLPRYMRMSSRL